MQMLVRLMLSQRSLRLSSSSFFFLILFFYILFCGSYFNHLSSRSHICSSASVILLLIPSSVLFISVCLFFSSSGSLVNISCIFSIPFQDPGSSSLSMFWILFLEDCLCLLHLVFFFLFFSGVLSCPFIWDIILCIFILNWQLNFLWCGFCYGSYGIVVLASFICALVDEAKRAKLMQTSWWEGLTVGETGSCSGGQGSVFKL